MSVARLSVFLIALGLSSCANCGRSPPVQDTLKADGQACTQDEQCESSLCDKLPGKEKVCFKKCSAVCKPGDICTALAVNDRFACVPEMPGLCQPCALNVDCPYPGDRCLEIGGTKVCTRDCSFDGQCPSSFRCADGTDTNGVYVTKQCQPTSGTCSCVAASAGQTTPCTEANTFGTCTGVRTCRPPNGYEACTAPVPTTEACNGRDDDCNGMTDENLGETTCGSGECRRTVTNCVNGAPQACDPLAPTTEICDGKDNDCDSVTDEGFDKQTSIAHCGACNQICARPNAAPLCMAGMCSIGSCNPGFVNADGIDANGCETMCTVTGVEICDGTDNDCDGLTDEGFTIASDPLNCGLCGRVCNVNNGNVNQYACFASTCGIATCASGFADCDQAYGTGCEKPVSADVNNCGGCNLVCATANATPACVTSACAISSCNPTYANCDGLVPNGCEVQLTTDVNNCTSCGTVCATRPNSTRTCMGGCGFMCNAGFVNLDGLAATGCEYMCTPTGVDVPELTFADSNCDAIDGDASLAIFVAPPANGGNDANPGTRSLPKATINTAIGAAAALTPKRAVYVSLGTYAEAVVMQPGVSVYGGYNATTGWTRSLANTTTIASPTATGVLAQNITLSAELQLFTITSSNASGTAANGDGRSSIGIHLIDSTAGVTVSSCTVTAGNGSAGAPGAPGATGSVGGNGGPAGLGVVSNAGAAGVSTCGATGGRGGVGVSDVNNGNPGIVGVQASGGGAPGNPGSGGAAGTCGGTSSSSGNLAPAVTAGGTGGNAGLNGSAPGQLGTVGSGVYLPASGLAGGDGKAGGGAGGGGSGGGSANGTGWPICSCTALTSGGGGGGGGGGCGGSTGAGGRGGGGSFAILSVSSLVTVTNSTLRTSTGGNGGTGGAGGSGGSGGAGGSGSGGQNRNNSCSNRSGGTGADGAQGGQGGQGGGASGGAGGPSIGVAYVGTAPTLTSNSFPLGGVGGNGGTGGTNGQGPAASGPAGPVTQIQPL